MSSSQHNSEAFYTNILIDFEMSRNGIHMTQFKRCIPLDTYRKRKDGGLRPIQTTYIILLMMRITTTTTATNISKRDTHSSGNKVSYNWWIQWLCAVDGRHLEHAINAIFLLWNFRGFIKFVFSINDFNDDVDALAINHRTV